MYTYLEPYLLDRWPSLWPFGPTETLAPSRRKLLTADLRSSLKGGLCA